MRIFSNEPFVGAEERADYTKCALFNKTKLLIRLCYRSSMILVYTVISDTSVTLYSFNIDCKVCISNSSGKTWQWYRFQIFSYMYGEEGYCLTSFQTAVNYLISEGMKAATTDSSWTKHLGLVVQRVIIILKSSFEELLSLPVLSKYSSNIFMRSWR